MQIVSPSYIVQYVAMFETLREMSCLLHVDSACFQSLGEAGTGVCKAQGKGHPVSVAR